MAKSKVVLSNKNDFNGMKDEDIIAEVKKGNNEALEFIIIKYRELVNMKVSKYFIIGAEKEDIIQEGLIGLFKAIKGYENNKENSFKTFANLCIERQLITAIKTSNRQKHMPLNSYLSLNLQAYEEDDTTLLDLVKNDFLEDPLDTIAKQEYYENIESQVSKNLSTFEKEVLQRYIEGESYVTIAEKLEAPVKSVDNAIQRIRKKALKNISQEDTLL